MPLQKLQFKPGVTREVTTLANEGGWYDCDKVRFRFGYPEKIGGWAALSYNTFLGVCRSLWNWVTLKQFNILGVGTDKKFYLENGGDYYDITPIAYTTTNVISFQAVTASPFSEFITVTDSGASALEQGDFVTFTSALGLGGAITAAVLNQEYRVDFVTSTTSYLISARTVSPINGYSFSVDTATSTITFSPSINAVFTNGSKIKLVNNTASPGGLDYGFTYYVVNTSNFGKSCQLSLTSGGPFITLTSPGIGAQALYFSVTSNASDTGNGGTSTDGAYQINVGSATATLGTGWGTGPWSRGTWNSSYSTGFALQLRLWSQANFGERLLFCPRSGPLYVWDPGLAATPAFTTRGTLISGVNVPAKINQIMVSDATRIVIAFGCSDFGPYGSATFDPLLIRWTAQESYTDWTPTSTNQAGDYRLSHGSEIVAALQTRQEILVWTDAAVYSMQYLGLPYVYGFNLLVDNISIASPNAVATASGAVFWMGVDKFYVYSGRVETLVCSVRDYVFDDMNKDQEAQIFAGTNEGYSEVWWFYCSKNSNIVDRYVIFNYVEKAWYFGTMTRTAWLDSPLRQYPQAATLDNIIVLHEAAVDDGTTNPPSAITSYIQSSDFDLGDGNNYMFGLRMIPDITFDGSNTSGATSENPFVTFTIRPRRNPGSNYTASTSPSVTSTQSYADAAQTSYNVQQFTEIIYTRIRGRQIAFRVESNTVGTQWQLGVPKIDLRLDGRR